MHNNISNTLFGILLVMSFNCYAKAGTDTTRLYFRLDVPSLDGAAIKKLDSLLYYDVINNQQNLLIVGYADHLGTNDYNDTLSAKRAGNVRSYLEVMGIPGENITLCIGKGEVPRDVELPRGYAADRRVDIVPITKAVKQALSAAPKRKKAPVPEKISSKDAIKFNSAIEFDPFKVEVGQLFVLDKIWFYTGRHVVVEESLPELDRLYEVMADNPRLVINIEGHVCCVHPSVDALDMDTGEVALSLNRAKYIYNYLLRKGIESRRMAYEGFGKTRPLSISEYTMEEQNLNKRVEIRIIKK